MPRGNLNQLLVGQGRPAGEHVAVVPQVVNRAAGLVGGVVLVVLVAFEGRVHGGLHGGQRPLDVGQPGLQGRLPLRDAPQPGRRGGGGRIG